ncbi:MAG: GNAT family N-acetyltransferase [Streptosporangiales bacterium]|nr:GNAT family N-acetyltransferase [Streptosporangiales bacterium]
MTHAVGAGRSAATVRLATGADVPALAALRRDWTAENGWAADEDDFERRFAAWFTGETERRVTWLAELAGQPVGMLNLVLFDRMPRPGLRAGGWAYLANLYVRPAHRGQRIGGDLLDGAVAYAREHHLDRIVLHPSERSVPFYRRAGFGVADMLLVHPLDGAQR